MFSYLVGPLDLLDHEIRIFRKEYFQNFDSSFVSGLIMMARTRKGASTLRGRCYISFLLKTHLIEGKSAVDHEPTTDAVTKALVVPLNSLDTSNLNSPYRTSFDLASKQEA